MPRNDDFTNSESESHNDNQNVKADFWAKMKIFSGKRSTSGVEGSEDGYNKKNEKIVRKNFWTKIKKFTGKIPFAKDAVSLYYCAIDSKTPLYAKGVAFAALAYFILPIDAIPDAIFGAGMTDDAAIITAALTAIGKNVTDAHKEKAEKFFNPDSRDDKDKKNDNRE
ncbi:YkvA family protein [Scopulibacillus cellulosilyticus]|uniref:YkvA family protein n=1 Tax=Scopulibacillus cellulosilyticus TaxID=2665665 RepID=A0ABW2Q1F0_9BACL